MLTVSAPATATKTKGQLIQSVGGCPPDKL